MLTCLTYYRIIKLTHSSGLHVFLFSALRFEFRRLYLELVIMKLKVKDKLCRELPTVTSDVNVNKDHDLQVAQIKIAELQAQVGLQYLGFYCNLC